MQKRILFFSAIRSIKEESRQLRLFKAIVWVCVVAGFAGAANIIINPQFLNFVSGNVSFHLVVTGLAISMLCLLYFLLQSVLAFFYRQSPSLEDAELPRCTVIVPAYNEGRYVATTLKSVLDSNYPADKLEVIAINDGSEDDTWKWIYRSSQDAAGRIIPINLHKNGGKRHALYHGFQIATGDIVVTIDSDSEIEPDALRKIASPFANPKVGAVAGNIRVSNLDEGIIPKMLDVAFAFGFEFMRCAQSVVRSVLCTPGALSAYRLSAIRPFADEWVNQTFLGRPSGIGEDRALSSMVIREGWSVSYQNDAIAYTKMPTCYRILCKMLIRWCRSDVRENFMMLGFVFSKKSKFNLCLIGLLINLIFQSIAILLPLYFIPLLICALFAQPLACLNYTFTSCILWSSLPALIYGARYSRTESVWAFVYGFYSIPMLSWISVYSFFTMCNSKWLTRSLPAKSSSLHLQSQAEATTGEVIPAA